MRLFKSKSNWTLLILFFSGAIAAGAINNSLGQDQNAETESVASPEKPVAVSVVQNSDSPSPIEPTPAANDKTVLEKIDSVFEFGVNAIAKVLFYEFFVTETEYIVVEKTEEYIRDAGSKDPFQIYLPKEKSSPKSIKEEEVTLLSVKGVLLKNDDGKVIQNGKIDNRPVEYISMKLDFKTIPYQSKYILDPKDNFYHKVLPKRDLRSQEETITEDEVNGLANLGWLKIDKKSDSAKPWIFKGAEGGAPFVVLWLAGGAIFFTLYMGGYNFWGFRHAVEVVSGKYDNPEEDGEVTHFQALASALSATVGLGNIAGVTIAMVLGGPGAFFWMIMCGLFGMTSKFVECTLGQKYRKVNPDGTILGGPMRYLQAGLAELGIEPLGFILAFSFAIMCILASFGGGNMFQANQSGTLIMSTLQQTTTKEIIDLNKSIKVAAETDNLEEIANLEKQKTDLNEKKAEFEKIFRPAYGIVLAILVGIVIIGGIKRIGKAAEKVVPTMCGVYILACLWIIFHHLPLIPSLVGSIITEAFTGEAMGAGFIGVLIVGFKRAAFSNEAGVGSAAIAHSAAKTDEPVREGSVALLGPFIDTIVVCSMTALVILITNAWNKDEWILEENLVGAELTARAFSQEIPGFEWVLSVAVFLFAYSTIISWSYYGERCWEYIFGRKSIMFYKLLTVICVFIGAIVNLGSVLDFSDMMILSMAVPNILGVILLAPKVKRDLNDYWKRYKNGEFKTFK